MPKLLIIEDEKAIREMFGAWFTQSGYEVLMAENGRLGLCQVAQFHPQVVLLDLHMPEMNGFEVIPTMAREYPETPLIVVSGAGMIQDVILALRSGAWDYVTKPVNFEVLAHAIKNALDKAELLKQNRIYHQNLEEMVARRTRQLEDRTKELAAARNAAEESNRIKGQFLSNVSHELRTPLNGIMGMAELLSMTDLDDTQKEYLDLLQQAARRQLKVVSDILDFTLIDRNCLDLENQYYSLQHVVRRALRPMRLKALDRELDFGVELHHFPDDYVAGDPARLAQIISNLVDNAIKFTPAGGVVVKSHATIGSDDRQIHLRLAVIDSGIGIPEELQTRIFDKFTQADASSCRSYDGIGLGLTIANQLAHKMGGTIAVDSRPGEGSTFTLQLSLARASAARPDADDT